MDMKNKKLVMVEGRDRAGRYATRPALLLEETAWK